MICGRIGAYDGTCAQCLLIIIIGDYVVLSIRLRQRTCCMFCERKCSKFFLHNGLFTQHTHTHTSYANKKSRLFWGWLICVDLWYDVVLKNAPHYIFDTEQERDKSGRVTRNVSPQSSWYCELVFLQDDVS